MSCQTHTTASVPATLVTQCHIVWQANYFILLINTISPSTKVCKSVWQSKNMVAGIARTYIQKSGIVVINSSLWCMVACLPGQVDVASGICRVTHQWTQLDWLLIVLPMHTIETIDTLTGEPVLVSVPLHYAGFLCKVDVCRAWNLRQFLQKLHSNTFSQSQMYHTYIHSYYNTMTKNAGILTLNCSSNPEHLVCGSSFRKFVMTTWRLWAATAVFPQCR